MLNKKFIEEGTEVANQYFSGDLEKTNAMVDMMKHIPSINHYAIYACKNWEWLDKHNCFPMDCDAVGIYFYVLTDTYFGLIIYSSFDAYSFHRYDFKDILGFYKHFALDNYFRFRMSMRGDALKGRYFAMPLFDQQQRDFFDELMKIVTA